MRYSLARASFDRYDALLALILAAFEEQRGRIVPESSALGETLETLRRHQLSGDIVLAHSSDGELAGCLFLEDRDEDLYFFKLAVHPEFRGLGLARELVDYAVDLARLRGHPRLTLSVRKLFEDNIAMFERFGFEKTGEGTHPGAPAPTFWKMARRIGPG